jgi:hypothetical protein
MEQSAQILEFDEILQAHQVVAEEKNTLVVPWSDKHDNCTDCRKNREKHNYQPFSLETGGHPSASNDCNYLNGSEREIKQD